MLLFFLFKLFLILFVLECSNFSKNMKKNHVILSGKDRSTFYSGTASGEDFCVTSAASSIWFWTFLQMLVWQAQEPQRLHAHLGPGHRKVCPGNSGSIQMRECRWLFSFLGHGYEAENSLCSSLQPRNKF